jgi:hypothetical protein
VSSIESHMNENFSLLFRSFKKWILGSPCLRNHVPKLFDLHRIIYLLSKTVFSRIQPYSPPALFCSLLPCGPCESNFAKKYFSIKDILFDVVFYADPEYHGYFARKSIFGSQNREIRVQLFNPLPPISQELISQP